MNPSPSNPALRIALPFLVCGAALLLGPLAGNAVGRDPQALAVLAGLLLLPLLAAAGVRRLDFVLLAGSFAAIAFFTAIRHRGPGSPEEPNPFYDWTFARATAPELLCIAALAACWMRRQASGSLRLRLGIAPWLALTFLVLGLLVGLLRGNSFEGCLRDGRKIAYVALAHWMVVAIADDPARRRLLVRVLALALVGAAIVKIGEYLADEGFHYKGFLRSSVDVADFLGFLGLIFVPAALLKAGVAGNGRRLLLVCVILAGSAATISTFSRAAWCAAPVGLVVIACHPIRRDRAGMASHGRRLPRVALGLALLATIVAPLLFGGLGERALERVESLFAANGDPSVSYRVREFRGALDVALEHPVVGVGLGSAFDAGSAILDRRRATPTMVHNLFLWSALKAGLPGLLLVGALLGLCAVGLSRAARWRDHPQEAALALGLLAVLASFAVIGLVGAMLNQARTAFVLGTLTGFAHALAMAAAAPNDAKAAPHHAKAAPPYAKASVAHAKAAAELPP